MILNAVRTISFSDAVIAIALTLLAIELPPPEGGTPVEVMHSFAQNLDGEYLSFLISFAVISAFWYQHHRLFERIERVDTRLTLWNLLSLLAIVLIPFATKLLSAGTFWLGPVFYASTMLLWGLSYVLMVRQASRAGLWRDDVPPTAPRDMVLGASAALAMFAVSIPIAFVSPSAAMWSWLLIPVVSIVGGRIRGRVMSPR